MPSSGAFSVLRLRAPRLHRDESSVTTKNSKLHESIRIKAFVHRLELRPQTRDLRAHLAPELNLHVLARPLHLFLPVTANYLPVTAKLSSCYRPVSRAPPNFAQPLVIQIYFPAKAGPETANSPCFPPVIREYQGESGRRPLLMTLPSSLARKLGWSPGDLRCVNAVARRGRGTARSAAEGRAPRQSPRSLALRAAACYGWMMTATLTAEEALDEFRAAGALLEGHFILSSGLHSAVFLQKMFVFQDPARTERLCRALAEKAREAFGPIDIVASPAVGGIVPGYETARQLGAKAIFVEREDGRFRLRRGFTIPPGARVLMVEDIITTGLSSRETLEALAEHPGTIVGAACLIDRSGGKAEIGVRRVALATLDIPSYSPDALPAELAALPAVKPGSRALAGAA